MPRVRTHYVCSVCGYTTPRWVGRCSECGEWNTLQEETQNVVKHAPKRGGSTQVVAPVRAYTIEDLPTETETRLPTGIAEFDRVLGGGVVPGSLTLIGGEPGIGKSTLMLQVANALAKHGTVLYITGEESLRQVRMRAVRLHATHPNLKVATGAELEPILSLLETEQPLCAIIDSIQTLYTPQLEGIAGTVSQIRTCAGALQRLAKEHEIALFLIGHVTKEGALAGPKVLEHLVDTVLYFEGDPQGLFRILRATKNRFGATDEIGVFDMRPEGLVAVPNPSERLLAERAEGAPGSVVFPALEGSRALLMEIQALTTPSFLNNPRRVITGLSYERVSLVLAVMEKRLGFRMIQHDVFVNVAGGMRVMEPAADLAILVAVASAMRNQPVRPDLVLFGEVGLGGEVRGVPHMEARLQEAARLGFRYALVPQSNLQRPHERLPLTTLPVRTAQEAIRMALQSQPEAEEPEEDDSPFR
ncbi:MAG: DNA repair protein RadA [Fimbriimonadales bacterium]|nr:DNA repair protein RadA [Fimbriimonadales bacterium]GBC91040.1 DNA repair protein RadA [bacterium HR14]GIV13793.1 MAG: DNA repair protein RadA [Fimbriimonadales bacterium]CUU00937.1 DNA repair protein RadA/Sms [Armatimonadetes bacterium GBS]CUU34278.1 DNA repair protein RadA/Sms [Armatimonadetes bacterium GXS]